MNQEWIDQTNRMSQVRAELSLLSYASAAQIGAAQCRQKPSGGNRPPGDPNPLHLLYWERFVMASTFERREDIIAKATDALIEARVRTTPVPVGESDEERDERIVREGEGFEPRMVAVSFKTGATHVVRLRLKNFRDPTTGYRLPVMPTAKELALRGLSARQIAVVLGCKPSTAQYHVTQAKRAA